MNPATLKLLSVAALALFLLSVGAGSGAWLAARHYLPLLNAANQDLIRAASARDNLEALAGEQGRKLSELVKAGELREQQATVAQEKARQDAGPDYSAANRLLWERSGGNECAAAESVIDQELGL